MEIVYKIFGVLFLGGCIACIIGLLAEAFKSVIPDNNDKSNSIHIHITINKSSDS